MLDEIFGAFAQAATGFGEDLLEWMGSVHRNGAIKWSRVVATGSPCAVYRPSAHGHAVRCTRRALASCLVCRDLVCLEHACIAPNADVVCVRCCDAMAREALGKIQAGDIPPWISGRVGPDAAAPPPRPGDAPRPEAGSVGLDEAARASALRLFGLRPGASDDELRKAFKRASAPHHPDRQKGKTASARAAHEARFKELSAAYALLRKHGTSAARTAA